MKSILKALLMGLILTVFPVYTFANYSGADLARELNSKGYNLYKQAKYEKALEMFKKSYEADDTYYLAHYNFACTLGVLMKKEYEFWYDRKEEAIEHIKRVVELKPSYVDQIKKDPDLDLLRGRFNYYLALGLLPNKTDDVKRILSGLSWYIEGPGIYQYIGGASFALDNTFYLWYYSTTFFRDSKSNKLEYRGIYSVNGNRIVLRLNKEMLRKRNIEDIIENDTLTEEKMVLECELLKNGTIKVDIFEYPLTYYHAEFSA